MLFYGLCIGIILGAILWWGSKIKLTAPFARFGGIRVRSTTTTATTYKTWLWGPIVKRMLFGTTTLLAIALLFALKETGIVEIPKMDNQFIWELWLWGSFTVIVIAIIFWVFDSTKTAKTFATIGLVGLLLYIVEPLSPCFTQACTAARQEAQTRINAQADAERKRNIIAAEERVTRDVQQKRLAAPPPDSQCTNLWEALQVGPTPVVFNQGGSCRWRMKSTGNCFKGTRASWTKDKMVYNICDKGAHTYTEVPEAIESLWTADGQTTTVLMLKYPDPVTRPDLHPIEKLATSLFGRH